MLLLGIFPTLMPASPTKGQKAPKHFQVAVQLPKGPNGLRFMAAIGLGDCMKCRLAHAAREAGGHAAALQGHAVCMCYSGGESMPPPAAPARARAGPALADRRGSVPQTSGAPSS